MAGEQINKQTTVEPLYYGHQEDRNKCPYYRGARFREVGFIWISVSQGPSELSAVNREVFVRRGSTVNRENTHQGNNFTYQI